MGLKAEDVRKHLARHDARLVKIEGEELGGFVLIVPPEGEPIELLLLGSDIYRGKFMKIMIDRIIQSGTETGPYGAVRVPGQR